MTERRARPETAPARRSTGVRRMAELLDAAASVFAERGYASSTMAEIAKRAGARIGSLYYFFPSKDAVARALVDRYKHFVEADHAAFAGRPGRSVAELADFLIDAIVRHGDKTLALVALLDARDNPAGGRSALHGWAGELIVGTLRRHTPGLSDEDARTIAAILLANMKTMADFTADAGAPAGAVEELRAMNRLYLTARLGSG